MKKRQKRRLKQLFFKSVMISVMIGTFMIGSVILTYHNSLYAKQSTSLEVKENNPLHKTLAVFGVDEEGLRTDVIFVLNYNNVAEKLSIISIPRDTKVNWTPEQQNLVKKQKGYTIHTSKINEMTSYMGMEFIRDLTIPQIENILDIQIDNYVIITLDAFRQIVDAVGGVDVEVPALNGNGLHYDDNYQDLHIHLEPGMQHLDGKAAEGLVRYRKGYAEGDVGRIKTQQLFLEAFMKKIMRPSIIFKMPSILNTIKQTVTTDIKWSEVTSYIPYLRSINEESLQCHIVPGEGQYIGNKSYYVINQSSLPSFMEQVIGNDEVANDTEKHNKKENKAKIVKSVSIEVLNSTGINGHASKEKSKLEEKGYTVTSTGNYTLDQLNTTLIYAKDTQLGQQFLNYYPNARVREDKNIPYDICIVLGMDSTH